MFQNEKKPFRRSILKERLKASDHNQIKIPYACEDCVYFMTKEHKCNLGFKTEPHLKKNQDLSWSISGHLTFCRFLEID